MTDDPFLMLVEDCISLMNRAFVGESPAFEFYHQFRKLWDRGIPVGMGLGHLIAFGNADGLRIDRLGEHGRATESIAFIAFGTRPPAGFRYRIQIGPMPPDDASVTYYSWN